MCVECIRLCVCVKYVIQISTMKFTTSKVVFRPYVHRLLLCMACLEKFVKFSCVCVCVGECVEYVSATNSVCRADKVCNSKQMHRFHGNSRIRVRQEESERARAKARCSFVSGKIMLR